jgi:hypothetical protein
MKEYYPCRFETEDGLAVMILLDDDSGNVHVREKALVANAGTGKPDCIWLMRKIFDSVADAEYYCQQVYVDRSLVGIKMPSLARLPNAQITGPAR